MKKYFIALTAASLFLGSCVKDEAPVVEGPKPIDYSAIVINELCAKDTSNVYYTDASGSAADWIELYNSGNSAIDVAGMFITDAPGTEAEYQQIPSTDVSITVIPPKGFLVLVCGAADASGVDLPTQIMDGNVLIDLGISASKDSFIALYDPAKSEMDKTDDFNGFTDDTSFGRTTDAGTTWAELATKTPGAPNDGTAPISGTIVINEFMASNDSWNVPGDNGDFPDYIEVYNTSSAEIDMSGWYLSDDIADPMVWQVPAGTIVPANGFVVFLCDGTDTGLHTNFKLGSGGEAVIISQDGVTISDGGEYCDTGCLLQNPGTDNSYGRVTDGADTWQVFGTNGSGVPTPGVSNN
jgi:hypothetical protein